jgi:hypothetical protein
VTITVALVMVRLMLAPLPSVPVMVPFARLESVIVPVPVLVPVFVAVFVPVFVPVPAVALHVLAQLASSQAPRLPAAAEHAEVTEGAHASAQLALPAHAQMHETGAEHADTAFDCWLAQLLCRQLSHAAAPVDTGQLTPLAVLQADASAATIAADANPETVRFRVPSALRIIFSRLQRQPVSSEHVVARNDSFWEAQTGSEGEGGT